jgi:hypothetical protein
VNAVLTVDVQTNASSSHHKPCRAGSKGDFCFRGEFGSDRAAAVLSWSVAGPCEQTVIRQGLRPGESVGDLRPASVGAGDEGANSKRQHWAAAYESPMTFSEIFIRRRVMTTLVMAAILLFRHHGYRLLPVSDLPNVDFPERSW